MNADCPPQQGGMLMRPPRRRPSHSNIPSDLPPAAEILPLDHTIGEDEPFTAPCRAKSSEDLNLVLEWTNDLADSMDHLALHNRGDDDEDDVSVGSFGSHNNHNNHNNTSNMTEEQPQHPSLRPMESGISLYSIGRPRTVMPTESEITQRSRGVTQADSGMMSFCSMGSWAERFHVVSPEGGASDKVANMVLMDCEDEEDDRLMAPCLSDLPFRTSENDDNDREADQDDDEPIQFIATSYSNKKAHATHRDVFREDGEEESSEPPSKKPIMFGQSKHKASIYRSPSTEQQ
eukprot:scaffold19245_cov199-Amphora_coffeaeformis.AAC.2